jgi:hypothetical protein
MGPNRLDPTLIPLFFFCVAAGALVGSLVGAILLRAGAEFAENLQIKFGDAFLTVFLATMANGTVAFVIGVAYAAAVPPPEFRKVAFIAFYPVAFLIQSAVISARHNLTYWRTANQLLHRNDLGGDLHRRCSGGCTGSVFHRGPSSLRRFTTMQGGRLRAESPPF